MSLDRWIYAGKAVVIEDMAHLSIGLIAVVPSDKHGKQIATLPLLVEALLPFASETTWQGAIGYERIMAARAAIEAYADTTEQGELITWYQPAPPLKSYCRKTSSCGLLEDHDGACDTDFDDIPF